MVACVSRSLATKSAGSPQRLEMMTWESLGARQSAKTLQKRAAGLESRRFHGP